MLKLRNRFRRVKSESIVSEAASSQYTGTIVETSEDDPRGASSSSTFANSLSDTSVMTASQPRSRKHSVAPSETSPTHRHHTTPAFERELLSTTEGIVKMCPRFRILVLGKSGAGKSSLINAALGVDLAAVTDGYDGRAGVSNIDDEITSPSNPRFVLHDSQGFAAGEVGNFELVESFIHNRMRQPHIEDKLHAIWFCMEVPVDGSALFETADQRVLNLAIDHVPIFAVFTKYDMLVRKIERTMDDDGMDDDLFDKLVASEANKVFDRVCVKPLRIVTRNRLLPVPLLAVSTRPAFKSTLEELVKLTQDHVDETVWVIWAVAQRASADVNIDASINIGKKKYWKCLAAGVDFSGKTIKQCLDTIHKDIILIWNFHDPNHVLLGSPAFRALISQLVEDLAEIDGSNTQHIVSAGAITSVAAVVSGVVPPAAPFALPVAAGIVLAHWVYRVYRVSNDILRGLMGYIVDLTIVMQSLFWLLQARGGTSPVRSRLLNLAVEAYLRSGTWEIVHQEILDFVKPHSLLKPNQKEQALSRVIELIETHRFVPPESYKDEARNGNDAEDEEGLRSFAELRGQAPLRRDSHQRG